MFITHQFVFLHIPKTAGTFVHKVLRDLHCASVWQRKVHSLQRATGINIPFFPYRYREVTKHSTRRRIPEACDGSRAVVLAVRNPLDHYISHFRFNWWRNFPDKWFRDAGAVEAEFGQLAAFDFPTFVKATAKHALWSELPVEGRRSLGPISAEWSRFFCRKPGEATSQKSDEGLLKIVQSELEDVVVLKMESLNQDLKKFLMTVGFPEERVTFLDTAKKVYPGRVTRTQNELWPDFYTRELADFVVQTEWMLFELFPEYRKIANQQIFDGANSASSAKN